MSNGYTVTTSASSFMYGKSPTWILDDELTPPNTRYPQMTTSQIEMLVEAFKRCGLTPPKHVTNSNRGWHRFLAYALKRGRSNHPHNSKWKPIVAAYTAMQVAAKLEG